MPFVESPIHRIVGVNWEQPGIGGVVTVGFTAQPIPPESFPDYEPGGATTMDVAVSGLPPLSRTTLTINDVARHDEVTGGDFPDGDGQMFGDYSLRYNFAGGIVGGVNYQTSATEHWFGADSVSIHMTANLQSLHTGDGFALTANIVAGAGSHDLSGANTSGFIGAGGGTVSVTATATMTTPPVVSISIG